MAERNETKNGKKKGKGGKTVAGAALLLALLGGGGYFGLGIGNSDGGLLPVGTPEVTAEQTKNTAEQTQEVTEAPTQETKSQELAIRVQKSDILLNGQKVTAEELEEALTREYKEGMTVVLIDDYAIKSVYDNAETVLNKLHLPFEKKTAGD